MRLRLLPLLLVLVVCAAVASQATAARTGVGSPADRTSFGFSASAYGTLAKVGSIVKSGRSAPSTIACTNETGAHASNTVASVGVPPYVSTGVIDTTADSLAISGGVASRATADVHSASLLGGLITADEVSAVSQTSHDGSGFHVDASGSSLVNLIIDGHAVTATPPPNTRVNLPGVGHVILNEQHSQIGASSASLTVNMIHVIVTKTNTLGVPVGTEIIVGHAESALAGPVLGLLDGFAYGTRASVKVDGNITITSGPSALIKLGCLGTDGKIKSNTIASVTIKDVLTTGTVKTTAQGTVTPTEAAGETTSRVETVNLLNGLVHATVVKADAHASTDGTNFSFSDSASKFVSLSVAGHPEIGDNVPPNTKLTIAGLGRLYLHRVLTSAHDIEVRMIELVVTQSNSFNLPVGTDVRIGVAEASAH